eukprot:613119-Pelagomonas_calceolata.AAC.4
MDTFSQGNADFQGLQRPLKSKGFGSKFNGKVSREDGQLFFSGRCGSLGTAMPTGSLDRT